MNVKQRLVNAYKSGGIREIIRKTFFFTYYKEKNKKTLKQINSQSISFGLNREENRNPKIIVSLTSYPARFGTITLCLKSLLLQICKPDKIIVYLGCDTKADDITTEMRELEKYGITYVIDDTQNLRSHKKYYYAMQEYPNDIIVTADDDVLYPNDWLLSLYESYKKYPDAVSARRVHYIRYDKDRLLPYNMWKDQDRTHIKPTMRLIATGNSGVLYPPHCLKKEAFNSEKFVEICYAADDIWLKCMEVLSGVAVVWVQNDEVQLMGISQKNNAKLSDSNVGSNLNDKLLKDVMKEYKISEYAFQDK